MEPSRTTQAQVASPERLAQADKDLRDALVALAKQFPNLARAERWADLSRPSPAGATHASEAPAQIVVRRNRH